MWARRACRSDPHFRCDLLDLRERESAIGLGGEPLLTFGGATKDLDQLLLRIAFAGPVRQRLAGRPHG